MKKVFCLSLIATLASMAAGAQNFGIGTSSPGEKFTVYIKNSPVAAKVYNDSGIFRIGVATINGIHYGLPYAGDVMLQNYGNKGLALGTGIDSVRMYINKAGKIGIGTTAPSALLHINSATSPAVRIVDGTQAANNVLTSDASGNASWQAPAASVIAGTLPATGPTITTDNVTTYTNANITLPAGKWLINLGTTAQASVANSSDGQYWYGLLLSDLSSSFSGTTDIISSISGSGIRGALGRGMIVCPVNGVLAVNNTSGGNKTYYVWAVKSPLGGTPTTSNWNNVTGNINAERYFYALKMN